MSVMRRVSVLQMQYVQTVKCFLFYAGMIMFFSPFSFLYQSGNQ